MSNKYTLLTFKGICMKFLLELKFFILSHPVTSKQPHKIIQIHMGHPVLKRSPGPHHMDCLSKCKFNMKSLVLVENHVFNFSCHLCIGFCVKKSD